jgi:hypothetical protein
MRRLWARQQANMSAGIVIRPWQLIDNSHASERIGPRGDKADREGAMERTGQCHCGSLRVITSGEPERIYLCHCKACQRRTGTAFHFGATYLKERVRLDGERKIYERDADSGYRIRFHFCPNCGTTLYWEGDRNLAVCGVAVGAFDTAAFAPPSDSIWEESMHPWLGFVPGMGHHQQNRPPLELGRADAGRRVADHEQISKWVSTRGGQD